jgi:hypothetical protein
MLFHAASCVSKTSVSFLELSKDPGFEHRFRDFGTNGCLTIFVHKNSRQEMVANTKNMHLLYLNLNKSLLIKYSKVVYRMNKIDMNDTIRSASCVFSLASPSLPALSRIYLWGSGAPHYHFLFLWRYIAADSGTVAPRETREWLRQMGTQRVQMKGSFLGWFVGLIASVYKRFLSCLGCV